MVQCVLSVGDEQFGRLDIVKKELVRLSAVRINPVHFRDCPLKIGTGDYPTYSNYRALRPLYTLS